MRYYIYSDNKPTEVSEAEYIQWENSEKYKLSFEEYFLQVFNCEYKIQVAYLGICSDFEIPKPFVLDYTKSTRINGKENSESTFEYFETRNAVDLKRKQLIRKIKKEISPGVLN